MSFSLLSVPTAALTGEEVAIGLGVLSFAYELFKDWKAAHPNTPDTEYPGFNPGGMFGGGVGRDELNEKYLDYVSELPATGYNSNGSLLIKAEILEHGYSSYGMAVIVILRLVLRKVRQFVFPVLLMLFFILLLRDMKIFVFLALFLLLRV